MLDLGLEHLGIDMDEAPNGKRQFDKVVNACGKGGAGFSAVISSR